MRIVNLFTFVGTLRIHLFPFYHFVVRQVFELYCQGVSFYEPYWDHALGFWKANLDRLDKILFLKYKEMIEYIVLYIKKLADVIGYPFSYEEIEKMSVDKVANMCSFENLSNLEVDKSSKHLEGTSRVMENIKGKLGIGRII
ncbi:flavonol sulfotransferase-like [Gossypium australe]|uniref:Sulfotransferase n=1 Tax=Gossypium australe TaxID=47621 RepID=A0A5B6V7G1_9ROSI|nr:flavonol sulfotransferase-like [Gossypium australe]